MKGMALKSSSGPSTVTTSPFSRYLAGFFAAERTPRGDHENLYRRGLLALSGAGRPPHTWVQFGVYDMVSQV